ncbi:MAG: hypothetical protein KAS90_01710 [Candidatus Aenigmarchaeota archaeon]|nr:hypothetical protein [Candidatus Aenigmarchaeota archaeon]
MPIITEFKDIEWELNKEENVWIGYNPNLELNKMGYIYAKLEPKQELKMHYHERPEKGDEAFIFYQPGTILLKTLEEEQIKEKKIQITEDNHLNISFKNNEPHGIKNIGKEPIIFLALYAPAFVPGEVKHIE